MMLVSSMEIGYNVSYNNIDDHSDIDNNNINIAHYENVISQYPFPLELLREIASAKLSKAYEWRELRSNLIFVLNSVKKKNNCMMKS